MVGLRSGAAVLLVAGLLLSTPIVASAHAELVLSVPADGAVLGVTPGSVLLYFSEQLDPSLSEATVTGPGGEVVTAPPSAERLIQVNLDTNLPGAYHVTWRAVSDVDGHTTSGAFSFTVGATPGTAPTLAASGPSATNWVVTIARWIEDLALILGVGSLFILWLGRREEPLPWVQPELLLVFGVALAAGIVVVTGEAVAAAGASLHGVATYLTTGLAGTARVARILLESVACIAVARRAYALLGVILVALVVALAASGHAASSVLAVSLDSGHVLTAGVWVGGIIAMATLHPPDGWSAGGRALLTRFTPWALAAFVATIALGFVQAILNVGTWTALVTTGYGRVLIAKSAAVLLLIPLSLLAWRRRSPHLRVEAGIGITSCARGITVGCVSVAGGQRHRGEHRRAHRRRRTAAWDRPVDRRSGGADTRRCHRQPRPPWEQLAGRVRDFRRRRQRVGATFGHGYCRRPPGATPWMWRYLPWSDCATSEATTRSRFMSVVREAARHRCNCRPSRTRWDDTAQCRACTDEEPEQRHHARDAHRRHGTSHRRDQLRRGCSGPIAVDGAGWRSGDLRRERLLCS